MAGMIDRSFGHEAAGDESLVVGIEGEWGSGKTSFIKLTLENLNSFRQRDYLIRVRAGGADQSLSNFDFFKAGRHSLTHRRAISSAMTALSYLIPLTPQW